MRYIKLFEHVRQEKVVLARKLEDYLLEFFDGHGITEHRPDKTENYYYRSGDSIHISVSIDEIEYNKTVEDLNKIKDNLELRLGHKIVITSHFYKPAHREKYFPGTISIEII